MCHIINYELRINNNEMLLRNLKFKITLFGCDYWFKIAHKGCCYGQ